MVEMSRQLRRVHHRRLSGNFLRYLVNVRPEKKFRKVIYYYFFFRIFISLIHLFYIWIHGWFGVSVQIRVLIGYAVVPYWKVIKSVSFRSPGLMSDGDFSQLRTVSTELLTSLLLLRFCFNSCPDLDDCFLKCSLSLFLI